jgi:hypothetical protein
VANHGCCITDSNSGVTIFSSGGSNMDEKKGQMREWRVAMVRRPVGGVFQKGGPAPEIRTWGCGACPGQ